MTYLAIYTPWELPCLSPSCLSCLALTLWLGGVTDNSLSGLPTSFYLYPFMRRLAISVALLAPSLLFKDANIPFTVIYKTVLIITQGA